MVWDGVGDVGHPEKTQCIVVLSEDGREDATTQVMGCCSSTLMLTIWRKRNRRAFNGEEKDIVYLRNSFF